VSGGQQQPEALLVIFGAGASFDSVGDTESPVPGCRPFDASYRPPLAAQLFENRQYFGQLIDRYPAMSPIVPRLRRSTTGNGTTLERELEQLQNEADRFPKRHSQLMAVRFYLKDAIEYCGDSWFGAAHGATNYAALLDEVERWRCGRAERLVTCVTFNYDTMLEKSAHFALGTAYNDIDSYIDDAGPAYIIKPHGSVDWGELCDLLSDPRPLSNHQVIEHAASLQHTNGYRKGVGVVADVGQLVPAIAIPFETKKSFACPQHHLEKLKIRVSLTTKALVIGWRGAESHFLEILARGFVRYPEILVVSDTLLHANETVATMQKGSVPGSYSPFDEGFSGLIGSKRLKLFLVPS